MGKTSLFITFVLYCQLLYSRKNSRKFTIVEWITLNFKGLLFFNKTYQETTRLFTDISMSGLDSFYYNTPAFFWTSVYIPQTQALVAKLGNFANCWLIRVPNGKISICLKLKLFSLPLNFGQDFRYAAGFYWKFHCWVWSFNNDANRSTWCSCIKI